MFINNSTKVSFLSVSFISLAMTTSLWGAEPPEPVHNGTKNVTDTIVITKPGVYDFKSVLHIWKGKSWDCGADKENGPQILRIEASDVTIKNFHYVGDGKTRGSKGLGDPIHIATCGTGQGNKCPNKNLHNVVLDGISGHACEDMITVGTPGNNNITVKNSYLKANPNKANWDKTVQINFGKNIKFYDNTFVGGVRCIRFKPNTSGEVIGNTFYGCQTNVQGSSNDADIAPMKNGPVYIVYKDNKCVNCGTEKKAVGSDVHFEQ